MHPRGKSLQVHLLETEASLQLHGAATQRTIGDAEVRVDLN